MNELLNEEIFKLQEELNNLDKAVKQIEKAKILSESLVRSTQNIQNVYSLHLDEIKGLNVEYKRLSKKTGELVDKIDKVDFPLRLDKIDNTVSSINQGLQNVQMRIENAERNIKDEFANKVGSILDKIQAQEKKIDSLKSIIFIILGILIAGFIGLAVFIKMNF